MDNHFLKCRDNLICVECFIYIPITGEKNIIDEGYLSGSRREDMGG
jgi:hypothetical protein